MLGEVSGDCLGIVAVEANDSLVLAGAKIGERGVNKLQLVAIGLHVRDVGDRTVIIRAKRMAAADVPFKVGAIVSLNVHHVFDSFIGCLGYAFIIAYCRRMSTSKEEKELWRSVPRQ